MQHYLDETVTNRRQLARHAANAVARHPILFGMLLSLPLAAAVIVIDTWFPGVEGSLARHEPLSDGVLFTVLFFGTYIYAFWRARRLRGFWFTLCALFAVHVAGVSYFSTQIRPLSLFQWSLLGFFEACVFGASLAWLASRKQRREHDTP